MALIITDNQYYENIAEAIRLKNGSETLYLPSEMAPAIAAIPSGTILLQEKTVTPTENTQTIVYDSGYSGLSQVTVNPIPSSYIVPTGSQNITVNGTYDIKTKAEVVVNVPTGSTINNQDKTVTPTELEQAISADSGYTGLGTVTVEGISSTYVGSGITRRNSTDLSASGATINVPAGYYAQQASKAVANGTAGTPVATKGTVSNHSVSVTPSVQNTTGYITGGTKTGTAITVNASELVSGSQTITSNNTYDVTNLASVVVNVSGGSSPVIDSLAVTPTESEQTFNSSSVDGYKPVTVGAISSTYVGSGIARKSSSDLTSSGATVTVPVGYYESQASKSISSGTVTAPSSISGTGATLTHNTQYNTLTLTKTVSVTPNVTTAGYISSGTAGNSSVSLTATVDAIYPARTITPTTTDIVISSNTYNAGAQTIVGDADLVGSNIVSTANIFGVQGTVVINKYYTGNTSPSSSLGNNGDIYLQS